MAQTKQLKGTADALTPIEDFANAWGVSTKTVQNWVEFTYQAFEILLPSSGPFPPWAIELLTLCAKHVSQKASMYFVETEETRRLKGTEYVRKIRAFRAAGHFQQFDQFRNVQSFQTVQPEVSADDLEDETFTELGKITRRGDSDLSRIKQTIEQREDAEIEELAQFIEDSDTRKMSKLIRRLKTGKQSDASVGQAIDVAYKRLPGS